MNKQYKKILAFDFDQTISVVHLFKNLSGWGQSFVPSPYGNSEWGHVQKIFECNQFEWNYDPTTLKISKNIDKKVQNQAQFSVAVLGGQQRVNSLEQYFKKYIELNCLVIVITRGYVGTVKKIMEDVGLSKYITEIYGNIHSSYGKNAYDEQAMAMDIDKYIGTPEFELNCSKGKIMGKICEKFSVKKIDSILIDDDKNEIEDAKIHQCFGLLVKDRMGVTGAQLEQLVQFCKLQAQEDGQLK